jgi:hypothetical protein
MTDSLDNLVADTALWESGLLSLLVAYALSQVIAAVYVRTHRGLSYSRSFVVSLAISGLVSAIVMLSIGNSLARGIGIVGTLALIRFRTNLHDPLDMLYVFASFGAGIAAGTGTFAIGVMGTAAFALVVTTLQLTGFGAIQKHDGVLRLQLPAGPESEGALVEALRRHCRQFAAITVREVAQGRALERIYQVTLRRQGGEGELIAAVSAVPGASAVSVSMQEATLEV